MTADVGFLRFLRILSEANVGLLNEGEKRAYNV